MGKKNARSIDLLICYCCSSFNDKYNIP